MAKDLKDVGKGVASGVTTGCLMMPIRTIGKSCGCLLAGLLVSILAVGLLLFR